METVGWVGKWNEGVGKGKGMAEKGKEGDPFRFGEWPEFTICGVVP